MAEKREEREMNAFLDGILESTPNELVAGGVAGGVAKTVVAPLERIKILFQVVGSQKLNVQGILNSQQIYKGILNCFSMTYREAGLRGLYRGVGMNLKTACFISSTAVRVCYERSKATIETLDMIAQKQGWKQLFSRLSINYLKVVPSVAIGFTVYDITKSCLGVPSRDEAEAVRKVVTNKRSTHPSSLHS